MDETELRTVGRRPPDSGLGLLPGGGTVADVQNRRVDHDNALAGLLLGLVDGAHQLRRAREGGHDGVDAPAQAGLSSTGWKLAASGYRPRIMASAEVLVWL